MGHALEAHVVDHGSVGDEIDLDEVVHDPVGEPLAVPPALVVLLAGELDAQAGGACWAGVGVEEAGDAHPQEADLPLAVVAPLVGCWTSCSTITL